MTESYPPVSNDRRFSRDESLVPTKLKQQASDRRRTLPELLGLLRSTVPDFAALVSASLEGKPVS